MQRQVTPFFFFKKIQQVNVLTAKNAKIQKKVLTKAKTQKNFKNKKCQDTKNRF